jgi:hypothetical protein
MPAVGLAAQAGSAMISPEGQSSMKPIGTRGWIIALVGFCPLGCATGSEGYAHAVDAQAAACDAMAKAPQDVPGQKEELEACRSRLHLVRHLAATEEAEFAATLGGQGEPPRGSWQLESVYYDSSRMSTWDLANGVHR